ncbi:MAG: GGDEF domain-containing protein [Planctomycetota bacterium]
MSTPGSGSDNKLLIFGSGMNLREGSLPVLECAPDSILIVDSQEQLATAANLSFVQMLGLDLCDMDGISFQLRELVHPDDQHRMLHFDEYPDEETFEVRFIGVSNDIVAASASARSFKTVDGREHNVYFFRHTENIRALEQRLQDEIETQKRRTVEAVRSSLRIYQLTEKMRATPKLSTVLLEVQSENDVFEGATAFLQSEGLNYSGVAFYLHDGDLLRQRHGTDGDFPETRPLNEDSKYRRFLDTGEQPSGDDDSRLASITTKGGLTGIMEVVLDPRERHFLSENRLVERWHHDILETIAEMLGLCLENIRLYEELRLQTIMDALTGCHNRHFLVSQMEKEVERTARTGRPLSLIFIDVDGFKEVNDTYGHAQGDLALQEISRELLVAVRTTDFVCRYGGDEFVLILPETDMESAEARAEGLRERIESLDFTPIDESVPTGAVALTISVGLASSSGRSAHQLLQVADAALYGAKRQGKNRVIRLQDSATAGEAEGILTPQ